jgi:hypothetical protein
VNYNRGEWLTFGTIGDGLHAQWKLIAQAATLLD